MSYTADTYETLETFISSLLQGNFFECKPLPDNQNDFSQGLSKPRVYVCYDGSDFSDRENLSRVVQEDSIRIGFDIEARLRRGENGIFAIKEIIKNKILGLNIAGFDKFRLLQFTPLTPNSPNTWHYYMQFSTITHVLDVQPEDDANILEFPEFIYPNEQPTITVES